MRRRTPSRSAIGSRLFFTHAVSILLVLSFLPVASPAETDNDGFYSRPENERTFSVGGHVPTALAVSGDGKLIVVASDGYGATLWETQTGRSVGSLFLEAGYFSSAAFSPDRTAIILGDSLGNVRRWDLSGNSVANPISGHRAKHEVVAAQVSPDGKRLVTVGDDGNGLLWDGETGAKTGKLDTGWFSDPFLTAAFSPDGKLIATGSKGSSGLQIWDSLTGKRLKKFDGVSDVQSVQFSPDSRRVALVHGYPIDASLWDVWTGVKIKGFPGDGSFIRQAVFSADGKKLLVISAKGWVTWDSETKNIFYQHKFPDRPHRGPIAFSAAGMRMVEAREGSIRVWKLGQTAEDAAEIDKRLTIRPVIKGSAKDGPTAEETFKVWYEQGTSKINWDGR